MGQNSVKVPIAIGGLNELYLPASHHTSMNFLHGKPVYYRHCVKKEHLQVPLTGKVYAESLSKPTFGKVINNLRAFYVPYRLVFPNYDYLRANVIASSYQASGIVNGSPRLDANTIQYFFETTISIPYGPLVEVLANYDPTDPNESRRHDYSVGTPTVYYRFTPIGRRYYSLLKALGYRMQPGQKAGVFYYDCLGLLCYARVYLDWYSNSQYLDSNAILSLEQIFKYNDTTQPLTLSYSQFSTLIQLVFVVTYDSDPYFNKSWDTPVSPTLTQQSLPAVFDVTQNNGASVVVDASGTPYMHLVGTNAGTQYIHDILQRLSNYQRRHALSGARLIDRLLVDNGFIPEAIKLDRSVYVGNNSLEVQLSSVMSHADTNLGGVSNLGDRAGAGFGNGQGFVDYTADEDGMFVVVSTIIPSGGFVQGYDRNNRHLNLYDFADSNFEVGVQVLEKGEVYVSGNQAFGTAYDLRFGFTGRYGEYKRPISWDSSENSFDSVNFGVDAWTLFRLFNDDSFSGDLNNVVHSLNFSTGTDWEQYNRIFNYIGSDRDVFECYYDFDVHVQTPLKPLFETYDFKEAHKLINMDINGTTLN